MRASAEVSSDWTLRPAASAAVSVPPCRSSLSMRVSLDALARAMSDLKPATSDNRSW